MSSEARGLEGNYECVPGHGWVCTLCGYSSAERPVGIGVKGMEIVAPALRAHLSLLTPSVLSLLSVTLLCRPSLC